MKIRHGAIVNNVVTYVYAKSGDDRLWNEKALAYRKSDDNNNNKNNVGGHWGPVAGSKNTHCFFSCNVHRMNVSGDGCMQLCWRRQIMRDGWGIRTNIHPRAAFCNMQRESAVEQLKQMTYMSASCHFFVHLLLRDATQSGFRFISVLSSSHEAVIAWPPSCRLSIINTHIRSY